MSTKVGFSILAAVIALSLGAAAVDAQQSDISFFITSAGPGKGGDLGGLNGADQLCQLLGATAGAGTKTWHAYLSTQGASAVNARDRIGKGPWMNSKGVVVAKSVADLHSDANNLGGETSLTEKGTPVAGNQHDILTGSQADGTLQPGDAPCGNWTSADTGGAMVGHHNKQGGGAAPNSWNSAHSSKGCSQQNLIATGGNGYFYCFAN
jgi:hypothetical protein